MDICNLNFLRLVLFSMLDGLAFLDSVCTYVFVSECMCVCVCMCVFVGWLRTFLFSVQSLKIPCL